MTLRDLYPQVLSEAKPQNHHTHAGQCISTGCYSEKQSHLKGSLTGNICLCVHKITTNVMGGGCIKYTKEKGSLTGRGVRRGNRNPVRSSVFPKVTEPLGSNRPPAPPCTL